MAADARPALIDYIKNQEQHHAKRDFVTELRSMVEEAHLNWKDDYLP